VILCKLTTKFSVKTVIELLGVQGAWTSLQHTHHTVAWQLVILENQSHQSTPLPPVDASKRRLSPVAL